MVGPEIHAGNIFPPIRLVKRFWKTEARFHYRYLATIFDIGATTSDFTGGWVAFIASSATGPVADNL
jgi:hypothetical protein